MNYCWAGKTLLVDLSTGKISTAAWDEDAKRFLGGRGGNSWLFWKHSKANQDPFDPDAPVIFRSFLKSVDRIQAGVLNSCRQSCGRILNSQEHIIGKRMPVRIAPGPGKDKGGVHLHGPVGGTGL